MEKFMDKNNAIEVNNITKDFKVYYDKGSELKEKMLFWKRKETCFKGNKLQCKEGRGDRSCRKERLWKEYNP